MLSMCDLVKKKLDLLNARKEEEKQEREAAIYEEYSRCLHHLMDSPLGECPIRYEENAVRLKAFGFCVVRSNRLINAILRWPPTWSVTVPDVTPK